MRAGISAAGRHFRFHSWRRPLFLHANPSRATSLASTNHSVMPANPWKVCIHYIDPIIASNSTRFLQFRPGDRYLECGFKMTFFFFPFSFSPIRRRKPFRLGFLRFLKFVDTSANSFLSVKIKQDTRGLLLNRSFKRINEIRTQE